MQPFLILVATLALCLSQSICMALWPWTPLHVIWTMTWLTEVRGQHSVLWDRTISGCNLWSVWGHVCGLLWCFPTNLGPQSYDFDYHQFCYGPFGFQLRGAAWKSCCGCSGPWGCRAAPVFTDLLPMACLTFTILITMSTM